MQALSRDQIEVRAYLLWEDAGRPEGRADEFWHRASAEVASETAPDKVKAPRKTAAATAPKAKAAAEPAPAPKAKKNPAGKKAN